MPVRIAIHGFGRIGRSAFRVAWGRPGIEIAAVSDRADPRGLAHLLRYDSVHGRFGGEVSAEPGVLRVGGRDLPFVRADDPAACPWGDLGIDVVLECTGQNTRRAAAEGHLRAGARWVVVSAPAEGADLTVVLGVNDHLLDPSRHRVVSNASCTTNCLAPILKVLHRAFGVRRGLVTTVHSYTNDQRLLDTPHPDLRRARAAGVSIVPTTTGAARAVGLVLPELADRLDGVSVRVPTPDVSLADVTVALKRPASAGEVNAALREAAQGALRGILSYTEEPLVSADYVGSPFSAVVDGPQTRVVGGDFVKLQAWYDNEWGYANRLVDLAERFAFRVG
ncbi:type I glyceraldehyde-3-phosphate dehydrogenase [Deferrisoma sp.]